MQENEILIIGGGIAGTSTAYHLSKYGHAVTLLERNELATEASGLNAGGIVSASSLEIFKMLQFDHGCDIEFRQSGNLKVIQTEEQEAFARQEALELTSQGRKVEILTAREARSIEPALSQNIFGCMYYPHTGMADPVKTTSALAELAQQQGATILTNHEVTDIEGLDDGTYRIVTQQETFKAKLLVLAAGPWCRALGSMLKLHIPVSTVRGQMWSTGPVPTRIFHFIDAVESMLYWHNNPPSDAHTPRELTHHGHQRLTRHLYGRQRQNGEIIFGGDRQVDMDKIPDPAGIEVNNRHAVEIFPFLQELPIKRTWAGWLPFTRELHPLIGKIPHFEGLYLLTGLCSEGFSEGPMAGKLLADYIHSGTASPVLSAADPAQYVTFAD
jgi:glycine/D-amino acid oxidase-like deaminating enzyme